MTENRTGLTDPDHGVTKVREGHDRLLSRFLWEMIEKEICLLRKGLGESYEEDMTSVMLKNRQRWTFFSHFTCQIDIKPTSIIFSAVKDH